MKKVLLMSLAAAFSFTAFAQEEDVTHLITNAGFNEGLTFTDEGKPTSETTATGETGEGARVLLSANGDYYAEPTDGKGTSVSGGSLGMVSLVLLRDGLLLRNMQQLSLFGSILELFLIV